MWWRSSGRSAQLFLSDHTIKTHNNRIFAKTGSRGRTTAIGYAHRYGIRQRNRLRRVPRFSGEREWREQEKYGGGAAA